MINIKPQRVKEIKKMLCSCKECDETNSYFEELQKIKLELDTDDNFDKLPQFISTLDSKERLIILHLLKNGDRCVCELEAILNKSQSTISHHLRKLVVAGLIQGYKKQNFTYYHLFKEELVKNLDTLNKALII